jgi:hypothetical protein
MTEQGKKENAKWGMLNAREKIQNSKFIIQN